MKVTPYRLPRPKQAARLAIPWPQEPIHYIARFDRLNNLKSGVGYIIGGTRYANLKSGVGYIIGGTRYANL